MTFHLHHGDCLAWMATLADKSADVTICDPPYEAQAHTQGRRIKGAARNRSRGVDSAPIPFAAISETERRDAAAEIARLTRRWALVSARSKPSGSGQSVLPRTATNTSARASG